MSTNEALLRSLISGGESAADQIQPTTINQALLLALCNGMLSLASGVNTVAAARVEYPPRISDDGKWMVYDAETGEYVSTEIEAPEEVTVNAYADLLERLSGLEQKPRSRVTPLLGSSLATDDVVEAVGIPVYVSDVSDYTAYGISETGWYTFARIKAKGDVKVTAQTSILGDAGHIMTLGADHIDVAVHFGVTAESQVVTINWGTYEDKLVFTARDLAVRNLDYRTTFYVYNIEPYITWQYALTADTTFVAGKKYYTKDGDTYTLAEVETGAAVAENTYYNHSKLHIEGMTRNITYRLDEIVDCPSEIALPEIEDDTHGCWFEIQMRHSGSYSMTLLPPTGVKVATEHTQAESAGMNMIDLHYLNIDGVKLWRFMNTHSTIPTT